MIDEIPFELFKKLDKVGFTRRSTYCMPKLDEALKWLRDEKKLYINPDLVLTKNGLNWDFTIINLNTADIIFESLAKYSSYEEATIEGIKYVLNNII